jgi:hypothetical protein
MKTKTFIMLCFLLSIGLTQLMAQTPKNEKAGTVHKISQWQDYWAMCFCQGNLVDYLAGSGKIVEAFHFTDGNQTWYTYHFQGEAVSVKCPWDENIGGTGESFTIHENTQKVVIDQYGNPLTQTFICNYIGNKGSHYIGFQTYDWVNDVWTCDKFVCVENGPNK